MGQLVSPLEQHARYYLRLTSDGDRKFVVMDTQRMRAQIHPHQKQYFNTFVWLPSALLAAFCCCRSKPPKIITPAAANSKRCCS